MANYIDKISEMTARYVGLNMNNIDESKYKNFTERMVKRLDAFSEYVSAIHHVTFVATMNYKVSSYDKDALQNAHYQTEMADKARREAHINLINAMKGIERNARDLGMKKFFDTKIDFLNKDFYSIPPSERDELSKEMAVLIGDLIGNDMYNSLDYAYENNVPPEAKTNIENLMNNTAEKYMDKLNINR